MKNIYKKIAFVLLAILGFNSCSDFDEINENPNAFTSEEVSAKFFMTELQIQLYAPNRYPYWRAQLIHADRYAGHFTFGFNGSWWTDALGYDYNGGYTDAAYDWMSGYLGKLSGFINFVKEGGDLQNEKFYAIGLIMKGLYYQMYVDTFGMAPYTEAFDPDNITPKYDELSTIYQGVIADLDEAMSIIGDATVSGDGVELLTNNDLFFGGDMQKWKKLANTLKLRMGLRAQGADGATFADNVIAEAMAAPLLTSADENALMEKDPDISQWANAAYGDVWWNFGTGSNWNVGKTLIDYLRNNNDPRLTYYATPIDGGDVVLTQDADGDSRDMFSKHSAFILQQLDDAGVSYTSTSGTKTVDGVSIDTVGISIDAGDYYVGQPTRLNGFIYSQVKEQLFSRPADIVINPKNQDKDIFPEVVMTAAEGNFLQAEAIVKGLASGDAQSLYQEGIRQAMAMWDVPEGDIASFLASEDMAQLNGTEEQNLEKIAVQRWIASYTDGFEAWAIVRDTGYPSELYNGVSDFDIYAAGTTLDGAYPQRMRYGNGAYNTNGDNTSAALQIQGPDVQGTKLWWAKN